MSPTPHATMAFCTGGDGTDGAADRLVCQRDIRARLVGQAPLRRERINPAFAQQIRFERERAEQIGKGGVSHIQPAGKCAEGRQNQPRRIGGKAAAADRAAAMRDPRHGMQVTADFSGTTLRQVTKRERVNFQRFVE